MSDGALIRSVVRENRDRDQPVEDDRLDRLGEVEQQFQLEVSGGAVDTIAWDTLAVTFDVEFYDATDQRYSNLDEPQIYFGSMVGGTVPVVVCGCVTGWVRDDREVIVGGTLAVGAFNPGGGTAPVSFAGRADFSIQGYGSVPIEPADPDFTG